MPFYEYSCPVCGKRFDLMRSLADRDAPARCPSCDREGAKREFPHVSATVRGSRAPAMRGMGSCGGGG